MADEREGEAKPGERGPGEEAYKSLGEIAATGGALLVGGFALFRRTYPYLLRAGIARPATYRIALRFHAVSSLLLGLAGLVHAYSLRGYAGPVEYALAFTITITMTSGLVLWFSRGKTRRLARMLHLQRALTVLLAVLLAVHIVTIED